MHGAHFLGIRAESLHSTPFQRSCFHSTLKHLPVVYLTHCTTRHNMAQTVSSSRGSHRQSQTLWRCFLLRGRCCWCDSTWCGKVILEHLHDVIHRVLRWGREGQSQKGKGTMEAWLEGCDIQELTGCWLWGWVRRPQGQQPAKARPETVGLPPSWVLEELFPGMPGLSPLRAPLDFCYFQSHEG